MPSTKRLIVNADDFGQSAGINDGVVEAFERGVVRSASLMVRWPDAAEAARYARAHPDLSVGLHLDLGEWTYRINQWISSYEVVRKDDHAAVEEEISRQFSTFNELMGRNPTHIDSHQHVHRAESVNSILMKIAHEIGAPLRLYSDIRYCGAFYGQTSTGKPLSDNIMLEALMKLLTNLEPGITELACIRPSASILIACTAMNESWSCRFCATVESLNFLPRITSNFALSLRSQSSDNRRLRVADSVMK